MTPEQHEFVLESFQLGKQAFERGDYRASIQALEKARSLCDRGTALQGSVQIWLITAYEAAGERSQALELCQLVKQHPDYETRKQAKRLLYILEAPKLRMKSEWLTEIPDLETIDGNDERNWSASKFVPTTPKPPAETPGYQIPEPTDPSKVEMGDERSLWFALGAALFVVCSLLWLGVQ